MADELDDAFSDLLGKKRKHRLSRWIFLALGGFFGVAVQIGPGTLAGWFGWSAWWTAVWGVVIALHSAYKSNVGQGILKKRELGPHWKTALLTMFPLLVIVFSALNYGAYWVASWIAR